MQNSKDRSGRISNAAALGVGCLTVVLFGPVLALILLRVFEINNAGEWIAVTARVEATAIDDKYERPPQWALFIDYSYTVDGQTFLSERSCRVLADPDYAAVERQQTEWPIGREFTVYYNPDNPAESSRNPAGEREGLIVVALLFTGILALLGTVLAFGFWKQRRSAEPA